MTNIAFTKTEAGFQLNSDTLPAPLELNAAEGKAFAKALAGDLSPAFKTDKLAWAPQSRLPIGLWVVEDGAINLWLAGVNHPLTADEAKTLGETFLLENARFKVGDEIITTTRLSTRSAPDTSVATNGTAPSETMGVVHSVNWNGEEPVYVLQLGENYATNCMEAHFKAAPPEQDYEVQEDGRVYVQRAVRVRARTDDQARALANQAFVKMGGQKGWTGRNSLVESDGVANEGVFLLTELREDAELNAAEGFTVSDLSGIHRYVDADNNAVFDDEAQAIAFVTQKAFAGSPRHQAALRVHLSPAE